MAVKRLGLIMHGITGRMGLNQHLVRSILAIREQGGVLLPDGDRVMPDPILVGRNAEKVEAIAKRYGITRTSTDLAAVLANLDDTVFFDAGSTQMRTELLQRAMAAGKAIYCEKPIAETLADATSVADHRNGAEAQERRGAGQAVPARPAEDQDAARQRLLRPHLRGARRVRLLGVRGRLGRAGAAPVVELPQSRWRRHHPRYAVPLALCARQSLRRGEGGELPRRQPYPRARRREGRDLRSRCRRRGLCDVRARRRRHHLAPTSIRAMGGAGGAATTSPPSRSTERMGPPSPACSAAGRSTGSTPRSRCGTPTCRRPSSSTTRGTKCRTRRSTTTASSCSGRISSATSSPTRPGTFTR